MDIKLKPLADNRCVQLAVFFLFLMINQTLFAAKVVELFVKGAIGPATADYLVRGIEKGQKAELILIKLDTPGGLDQSMRQIVQAILNSSTPVVTYVTPNGARAASAGTYILYASTVAAMAPGTHLGAASPVSMVNGADDEKKDKAQQTTMSKKMTNDAIAYIRTLAQLRGRNIDFAEKAVLDASTLTATEALKANVINVVAINTDELFKKIEGMHVIQDGRELVIKLQPVEIQEIKPDWRMQFLLVITDPTIAYLLLLLGIYGIFFELFNPVFIVPGVVGGIAILVALYALQLLPINYAGLALIILGLIFIIAEAYAPSFGVLGLGGTIAFIIGSILLIDTEHQSYQIAWSAIGAMAAANVLVFVALFSMAVQSKRRPVRHGTEVLIGAEGRSIEAINPHGQAIIHGEIWRIHAAQGIDADRPIKIIAAKGLTLEAVETKGE